ncbi:MAG: hypothetical protein ABIT10_05535 [Alteraurantiacibacter sp.]
MAKSYRPASAGMLPALPGTYLVTAYFDDNQVDLVKSNVLGWSVSSERTLTPLVIDPRAADDDQWHVIHPDGRVECTDGRCWSGVDAWVDEERQRWLASQGIPVTDIAVTLDHIADVVCPPVPSGMPEVPAELLLSGRPPSAPYATAAL